MSIISSFCFSSEILFFIKGLFIVSKPLSPFSGKLNLRIIKRIGFHHDYRSYAKSEFLTQSYTTKNYWRSPKRDELTYCCKNELESLKTFKTRSLEEKLFFRSVLQKIINKIPKKIQEIRNSEPMKVEFEFNHVMVKNARVKNSKSSTPSQIKEVEENLEKIRIQHELYLPQIKLCYDKIQRLWRSGEKFRRLHLETFY